MNDASYSELTRLIKNEGLMDKQPLYYAVKIASLLGMLALSLAVVVFAPHNFGMQALNAAFLAFVFVQAGLIMHDADHLQIFRSIRRNRICGLIAANFIIATSSARWTAKHSRHHARPNDIDLDPDVNTPILAFSEDQALQKNGVARFIVEHQARLWFPVIALYGFYWRALNLVTVVGNLVDSERGRALKHPLVETVLVVASNVIYFGTLFFFLDAWLAVFFIAVHHSLVGIYMASIFATNHKGMPLPQEQMDVLRMQTLTSRNVTGGPLTDFFMGGLNFQIEHHLFPKMPRNNLRRAQRIVKEYCRTHGIAYYETGFISSYREILRNFAQISAVLKKPVTS